MKEQRADVEGHARAAGQAASPAPSKMGQQREAAKTVRVGAVSQVELGLPADSTPRRLRSVLALQEGSGERHRWQCRSNPRSPTTAGQSRDTHCDLA